MNDFTKEDQINAYNVLVDIEKQVSDLHNTLEYWIQKLLNNIEWKDDE